MKRLATLLARLRGLTAAIVRYPLTAAFLLVAAALTIAAINTEQEYTKQLLTCAVGAILCAALQAAYERFFYQLSARFILMLCGAFLTMGYYLIIRPAPELRMEISIRTFVAILALYFTFLWVPVIRSRISFNESFMAAFKAVFHSAFYAAVIFGGCSLIIVAIDTLIVDVSYKSYSHIANIVFILFAPIFFLSLIPVYPGRKDTDWETTAAQEEKISRAVACPKFLEVLISYIIIPLTAVFTVILLLYIGLNIRGAFWTNNLLEPLLLSYAVAVILITILSSRLENKFAAFFRLIFPKVLIPIVLFQIASSILSLRDTGMTHPRYFVILFGLFAACAGVVMSVLPVRKNGIIAALLIGFSVVSIMPPVDAFTVSRASQEAMLKAVLVENGMLENGTITPNHSIAAADKERIVSSVQYLDRMDYTGEIAWLPDNLTAYDGFYETFGFYQYDLPDDGKESVNVFLDAALPLDIAGYDVFTRTYISAEETAAAKISDIENAGKRYSLKKEKQGDAVGIVLRDESGLEVITFSTDEIFSRYRSYTAAKSQLSTDEATFSTENAMAKLTVVVQDANFNISMNQIYQYANVYILVQFK